MTHAVTAVEDLLSGRNVAEIAEHELVGGEVLRPEACDLVCGKFSIGTHKSEIESGKLHTLILSTQSRGLLCADIGGEKRSTEIRSGTLTFVPAGLRQRYEYDGVTTNTVIGIDDALFKKVVDIDPRLDDSSILDVRHGWTRPALHKLIEEQHAAMASDAAGSRVLTESVALRLAVELLGAFGKTAQDGVTTPLSQAEINQLIDFIEDRMEDSFGLSDLAGVLDRDPFAFSRSFKSATGFSPHQYVIQRRLMRVKNLLINTTDTLADITYATGFSNQAHMTTTFAKHNGISPGRWRKAVTS